MEFNTEDDFRDRLDEDPGNWQLRSIFGDWLQERGDPRGPGFTAMGALHLVPDFTAHIPAYHDGSAVVEDRIGGARTSRVRDAPLESALPLPWYIACWGETEDDVGLCWIINRNLRALDDNVALAFQKLPGELQQKYLMGQRE